jgi:N-carbamoylputrescine amidase
MASVRVALVQARSRGADPELALREGESVCREAAARGADVVLFPELWQLGYTSCPAEPARRAAWLAHATTLDGPFVSRFREIARELGGAIVITYLEAWPGAPRNTATLIDRHGDPVLTYAKVHTCDFGMEAALTPGDGFRVADLDTPAGTVRVGLMICYDREFPESARVLMLGGAELILTPNACGLDVDRLGQFRARAYENMVGVAMANYAAPAPTDDHCHLCPLDVCNGHSVAFSGIRFDRDGNPSTTSSSRAVRRSSSSSHPSTSLRCAPIARTKSEVTRTASPRSTERYRTTLRCRCSPERTVAGRRPERRGRDSNPRCRGYPHNGFRDRPVQPLRHLSGALCRVAARA